MNDINKIIEKYTNPSLPGSFSGLSGFLKNNREFKNNQLVKKAIRSLPAYTLHKPIRHRFPRRKTIVEGIDDQWQVDLVDLTKESGSNFNYKYILTCIDVFSKYAWAIPILNKSAKTTKEAFEKIFADGRSPKYIYSDDGKEFKGECKQLLDAKSIILVITTSKMKAAVVERFNRTLKETIYRYFTYMKGQVKKTNLAANRYIDQLPNFIKAYNNEYHRSIKMSPAQVNKSNEKRVFKNLYGYAYNEAPDDYVKVAFKPGTYVRTVNSKNIFEKGYTAKWSKDILLISKVIGHVPLVYQVKSLGSEEPLGDYYAEQLQQVELPFDAYEVINENKDTMTVKQINTDNPVEERVNKESFLRDRYNLRERKK